MNFIVHDAAGQILRTGSCPPDHFKQQAGEGETVIEGVADDALHEVDTATGAIVARKSQPVQSYAALRRAAYPSTQDQLDALWKGGKAELDMKARIDAVKAKYPKDAREN